MARKLKVHELPSHRRKTECLCKICNRLVDDVPFLVLWSKFDPNKIEGFAHVECVPHKSKELEL